MKYESITIEGNIGSGKSSLAKKIAEDFKGNLVLEAFANNPFYQILFCLKVICFSAGVVFYGREVSTT